MSEPTRRNVLVGALMATLVALGAVAVVGATDAVVFYVTPTDAAAQSMSESQLRIGGIVVEGSTFESTHGSMLELTDGTTTLEIVYGSRLPDVIREGEGAVVEGRWTTGGVFEADAVFQRHSNEYRVESQP